MGWGRRRVVSGGRDRRPTRRGNSVSHSLSSRPCQVSSVSRPSGRNAWWRLANAASGSPKNIEPMREITMSNAPLSKGWICASAFRNSTLSRPSATAVARASASICDDRSTPSADPFAAIRAASRVDCPVPQPTSRTQSRSPIAAAARNGPWQCARVASNRSAWAVQNAPSLPSQAPTWPVLDGSATRCSSIGTVMRSSSRLR